jgi:hypothetical protein
MEFWMSPLRLICFSIVVLVGMNRISRVQVVLCRRGGVKKVDVNVYSTFRRDFSMWQESY